MLLVLAGCQSSTAVGPNGDLVPFGPVVGGRPMAYAPKGSPILVDPQAAIDRLLDTVVPDVTPRLSWRIVLDRAAEAVRTASGSPEFNLETEYRDADLSDREKTMDRPQPGITVRATLEMIAGIKLYYYLEENRLLVCIGVRRSLVPAYYPVRDLVAALDRGGNNPEEQLLSFIKINMPMSDTIEAWEDCGGAALLYNINGVLLVRQTVAGHRQLVRFLADLRIALSRAAAGPEYHLRNNSSPIM